MIASLIDNMGAADGVLAAVFVVWVIASENRTHRVVRLIRAIRGPHRRPPGGQGTTGDDDA